MKELSIEQKAKRYDEVVKEIKNLRDNLLNVGVIKENGVIYDNFNRIFPELKESEDDRIKRVLVDYFKRYKGQEERGGSTMFCGIPTDDILTWFEKQGEHEYTLKSSNIDVSKLTDQITKLAKDYDFNLPNRSYDIYAFAKDILAWIKKQYKNVQGKSELEAIKEEKVDNVNKVESTFKVGDWVVSPMGVYWHIDAIRNGRYEVTSDSGVSVDWPLNTKLYHRFTIQDAKDGDIIYAKSRFNTFDYIRIFSKFENEKEKSWAYSGVHSDCEDLVHWSFDKCGGFLYSYNYDFYPASKEQRDLLFQKMKEVGYEWDAEKKVLKILK